MKKQKTSKKGKKKSNSKANPRDLLSKYFKKYWSDRSRGFRFMGTFFLGMILFYLFYYSDFYTTYINSHVVNSLASLGGFLIGILGFTTQVLDSVIKGNGFSIDIAGGCDGIEVMAILMLGILAFPSSWKQKLKGIAIGLPIIAVLNLLRIPVLYLTGLYGSMELFDFLHLQGGFVIFVSITIIIWAIWASWAIKTQKEQLKA